MIDEANVLEILKDAHRALDDALGDSDFPVVTDEEEREDFPVQYAARRVAEVIQIIEQTRVAEQRDAPVHAEPKCPSCVGMGVIDDEGFIIKCFACDGTGILNRSAGG